MPKADVVVRMIAQDANVLRTFRAVQQGILTVEQALAKVGGASGKAQAKTSKMFGSVLRNAASMATAMVGVGSAMQVVSTISQLLRKELANLKAVQDSFADQQITVAVAEARAFNALTPGGDLSVGDLSSLVRKKASGAPLPNIFLAIEGALAARGALSEKEAVEAVLAVPRLRPDIATDTDQLKAFAIGTLQLRKSFKGTTADQAVSGVQQLFRGARAEELPQLSRAIIGGISQARAFGNDKDSFRFLSGLILGVGQRAEDPTGRRTVTGTIGFLSQIKQATGQDLGPKARIEEQLAFPLSGKGRGEEIRKRLVGDVFAGKTKEELQKQREVASPELSFQARTKIAFIEVLTPMSKTWDEINAAIQKLPGLNEEAVKLMKQQQRLIAVQPGQQALQAELAGRQALQTMRSNPVIGVKGTLARNLRELLVSSGRTATEADARSLLARISGSQDVIGTLESFEATARGESRRLGRSRPGGGLFVGGGLDVEGPRIPPTVAALEFAKAFIVLADAIKAQTEILKEAQTRPLQVNITDNGEQRLGFIPADALNEQIPPP